MSDQITATLEQTTATGVLEESPGVKSSKRVAGFALIGAGGLLLGAVGIAAIFRVIADAPTAISAGTTLAVIGASLLGVTVLEGLGNRIGGTR